MRHLTDALLRRLLGPREDELGCDECFQVLDEYVDVELSGGDPDEAFPGMRPHLSGCPACREDYESLKDLAR